MTALQKGQFTETPVKTEFGFHIIKLDDVRTAKFPTLEEVKPQIVDGLQQQKVQAYQQALVKKQKFSNYNQVQFKKGGVLNASFFICDAVK
jgi:peptidyl-prolyl cis-trans isomerase C